MEIIDLHHRKKPWTRPFRRGLVQLTKTSSMYLLQKESSARGWANINCSWAKVRSVSWESTASVSSKYIECSWIQKLWLRNWRLLWSRCLWPNYEKGNYCNGYDRIGENGYKTYTVEGWDEDEYESRVREDVPREMLAMIDKPYSTDWHKQGVFRHHNIGIPDEMMPDAWRNNMTNI